MATVDNRNGQQTTQNFETGATAINEINNMLHSQIQSQQELKSTLSRLRGVKQKQEELEKQLKETEETMKALYDQYGDAFEAAKNSAYKELMDEKASLQKRLKNSQEYAEKLEKDKDRAETAIAGVRQELLDLAKQSNQDVTFLVQQAELLSADTPFKKMKDNLAALQLAKANLEAEIQSYQIQLTYEDNTDQDRAELHQLIRQKQKELIEQTFAINAQQNAINEVEGKAGKAATNRIEQMFGKEFGGALNWLGNTRMFGGVGNILHQLSGGDTGSNLWTATYDASEKAREEGVDTTNAILDVVETFAPKFAPLIEGVKIANTVLSSISSMVSAINNKMGEYIDQAATSIASYYGAINANLYGYSDYKTISGTAEVLSGNTLVKQTDYLSQIASLSADGIARDIEAAAILQTIKDRTLTSFDVSNDSLRRLIRLGNEQVYQSQFGLELQLKKVLNSTFKDSGYLTSLFDSVTDAIMDASVAQKSDITTFNSVVQTWLGAMYSSGLSSNVVNQIASGINALGSGNVSALASDESTQRLFLLAMDRVGLDYADILQQGLSLSDTNQILQSVVEYLGEIAGNTSDNLVLKSSYANLFNLSMTDMQAIQNLNQSMPTITEMAVNTSDALSLTQYAASSMLEANTSISEKWDNFFKNFQYSLGASVAESSALYSTWRVSSIVSNLANSITGNEVLSKIPGIGTAAKIAQLGAGAVQAGISVYGLLDAITELTPGTSSASDVASLLDITNNISSAAESNTYSKTSLKSSSLFQKMSASVDTAAQQVAEYQEETDTGKILEEIEKTIMSTEKGYAFAVSLEGMNNEVLRSFASIFADEDAMLQTFKGTNKTIEDNLFTYLNDNSSNKTSSTKA